MMKRSILIGIMSVLAVTAMGAEKQLELAKPTPEQLAFMDMEYGAFVHYGLNVFTGQEHGDGFEPASMFNPTEQNVEQWVITAKNMGAKYACLTVRHEGGFCLWPTKTTDYSIKSSPYKDGKGDIMQEWANACRKHGIKVGIYHTASHDAHHTYKPEDKGHVPWGPKGDKVRQKNFAEIGEVGRQKYIDIQVNQMRELLTNYGEITYIWCDHWNGGQTKETDGEWTKAGNEVWRQVTDVMRELQPHCLMLGPDVETPGNEGGHVVYPLWNAMNTVDNDPFARSASTSADAEVPNNYGLLETSSKTGHPLGKYWRSRECTTNTGFHHGGWFWHPPHVKRTAARSLPEHMNMYYRSIGLGANAIINLPPDNRGLIPEDIAKSAKVLGDELRRRFANPVAEIKTVTVGNTVELSWKEPTEINTFVIKENIANGQKIAKYTFDALVDGEWKELKAANKLRNYGPYPKNPGFETIGNKKIDRVAPVTTNRIRFRCLEAVVEPVELRSLQVFNCAPLNEVSN